MSTVRTTLAMESIQRLANSFYRGIFPVLSLFAAIMLSSCSGSKTQVDPPPIETTPAVISPTAEPTTQEPTPTPAPTSTPVPSPTFDITSVEDWGAGRLIFSLMEHSFGEKLSRGIYALDLEADGLTEILPPGTRLLDISPDRQRILFSSDAELSALDLRSGAIQVLAEDLYTLSPSSARWDHSENSIYYLAEGESSVLLQRVDPVSGGKEALSAENTIAVLEADQGTVVLGKGTCNPFGECAYSGQEWISKEGSPIAAYQVSETIMLPCQTPNDYVYAVLDENGSLTLHIRPHGQEGETVFWAVRPEYADCDWSPDGTRLAVTLVDRFWYSGSIQDYYFQILIPVPYGLDDLSYIKAPLDQVVWSPDGKYVAFTGTELQENVYQVEINLAALNPFSVRRFSLLDEFQSDNYLAIPNLFWAP